MPDFVSSPTFLAAVVTFATVVLATVALGLLWEGVAISGPGFQLPAISLFM
jgi:hypothetical protein